MNFLSLFQFKEFSKIKYQAFRNSIVLLLSFSTTDEFPTCKKSNKVTFDFFVFQNSLNSLKNKKTIYLFPPSC